jgi:hypothetical protein
MTRPDALLLTDAAVMAGHSVSWIRSLRSYGPLEPVEIDGRQAVTRDSLVAYLAWRNAERKQRKRRPKPRLAWTAPSVPQTAARGQLRLIVNNE